MGRSVVLNRRPQRVISLVPSQTELLYQLGLAPIGQTVFCIKPEQAFKTATKIGGTKKLNIEKIRSLNPDLIIGNKEENDQSQIETLSKEFPVWMSDIYTIDDSIDMIQSIGTITGTQEKAKKIIHDIEGRLKKIREGDFTPKTFLYLIWNEPFMTIGHSNFINSMLQLIGLENCIIDPKSRYPEITENDINSMNPDLLLLSSEPFPFKDEHRSNMSKQFPQLKIELIDGEACSWYGSYMRFGLDYLLDFRSQINN